MQDLFLLFFGRGFGVFRCLWFILDEREGWMND